jgi:hypothetical protein
VDARAGRRQLRAGLVGAALAALTLAGHTAAHGSLDPLGTALVVVLSCALAAAVSGQRRSPIRLLAVLLGGQALLHLILTFTSEHAHAGGAISPSAATMTTAHVIAAVVATILILRADTLAARWSAFLSSVLGRRLRMLLPPSDLEPTLGPTGSGSPRLQSLLHDVVRRGPPMAWHQQPI